ncbi:MAG: hypothetical protein OES32_12470 [Acidobacteriota bacterium]|nr:hypothetical protein [Acidobacteriota bacterium]
MRNVTITLDEEVARWARIRAARDNTSVSRLLGGILEERMAAEQLYEAAMGQFLSRPPVRLKTAGSYPPRVELHER